MTNIVRVKTGGRQKGTPNRISMQIKEQLAHALAGEYERVPEYIEQLDDPRDKLTALIKLAPFVMTKVQDEPTNIGSNELVRFDQHID